MSERQTAVLIHGLSETREVWSRQVAFLQQSMNVITYDIRGFGASPTGAANGTVGQMADDLAQVLSATASGPAWLMGFSMGGVIAQRFALNFPDATRGLVLVASSCAVGRAGVEFFNQRIDAASSGGLESIRATNTADAAGCFATGNADLIAEYQRVRVDAVRDLAGYLNACRAMLRLNAEPLTGSLAGIGQPTLVIAGELDPYCPPKASAMIADAIPDAEFTVIENRGHCLQFEASDTLNRHAEEFMSSH